MTHPPDARLARIAGRQHGVVTLRQLKVIGIGAASVKRRVAKGRLVRLYRGVYAVGHVQRTPETRWIAAVMASGPGSVLSHLDAASLWQIYKRSGANMHVTTTAPSVRRLPGVKVHRARRLDPEDVTKKDGIPVTTVARTLIDLTDILPSDRILRAVREAEYLKLLDVNSLIAAVQRANGRRRLRALNEAIERHTPGQIVREELEHRFQELLHAGGLPKPQTNVKVKTWRGTYEVDCLWAEQGVAVELDGRDAHMRAAAFEEDRARDAALTATGLRPLRFTWRRLTEEPDDLLAELKATLSGRM
jgi:predicted transcriptional regulator of viral defense system